MRVVFQQVDMDTALTAWLLGIEAGDDVVRVSGRADARDLLAPQTLCIECGGSGQTHLLNFDHHNTRLDLPPACRQAHEFARHHAKPTRNHRTRSGPSKPLVASLVDYVATMDEFGPRRLPTCPGFPKLSQVFSGMRLSIEDPAEQLHTGIGIFSTIIRKQIDPTGILPQFGPWQPWLQRRQMETERLARILHRVRYHRTKRGYLLGSLQSDSIGSLGAMYHLGCEVAVAIRCPRDDGRLHYRIASKSFQLHGLLEYLQTLELGWGGPSRLTIIGSPREGSTITPEDLIEITRRHC